MSGGRKGQVIVIAELLLLPLLLAYLIGNGVFSIPKIQRQLVEWHNNRPRVNRERIKLDYDVAAARSSGLDVVLVTGSSQVRDLVDPHAVAAELREAAGTEYAVVNGAGSALVGTDLLALRDVWLSLRPRLIVYFLHPYHLNDWKWGFNEQRYDLSVYRNYLPELWLWKHRQKHVVGWLNQHWRWMRYRGAVDAIIQRQGRSLVRGKGLRHYAFDPYQPFEAGAESVATADRLRAKALSAPSHPLRTQAEPQYFEFPTRSSRALTSLLDLCGDRQIPVLLIEASDHPRTREFFSDEVWGRYEALVQELSKHPTVVNVIERSAYPDIVEHYVHQRPELNFLHARNARPIMAPFFARWINAAMSGAKEGK